MCSICGALESKIAGLREGPWPLRLINGIFTGAFLLAGIWSIFVWFAADEPIIGLAGVGLWIMVGIVCIPVVLITTLIGMVIGLFRKDEMRHLKRQLDSLKNAGASGAK